MSVNKLKLKYIIFTQSKAASKLIIWVTWEKNAPSKLLDNYLWEES